MCTRVRYSSLACSGASGTRGGGGGGTGTGGPRSAVTHQPCHCSQVPELQRETSRPELASCDHHSLDVFLQGVVA